MMIYSTEGDLAPEPEEINWTEGASDKDIIPVMWVKGTFQSENNVER